MARRSGQITQRGERTWLVRVFMGSEKVVDSNTGEPKLNPKTGKPVINNKYHNKTIHGSKKDAQAYLNKVLRERDTGTYIEPSRIQLNEYLDEWLDSVAKPRLRDRTYRQYQDMLRLYIRDHLGHLPLNKITPMDVQRVYSILQEKGLAARTIRYAHAVLNSALAQAVKWQFLVRNPVEHVELPRQQKQEMKALSQDEFMQFLEVAKTNKHYVLFMLALNTGMRPEEYLALQWKDIDWDNERLSIQRTLVRRGESWEFAEPKTARGRRLVPLPKHLVQALRTHKKSQTEDRLAAPDYEDNGLVFASEGGQPLYHRNVVRRHFKPLLKKAGLPNSIRLYDLRHTHATILLREGVNPKIVSERLGHASVALTLDTYSHVLPDIQKEVVEKLDALFKS